MVASEGLERLNRLGLDPSQLPRHIAIIMDGNGRWAQRRGLPRVMGHRRGVASVRAVVEEGCRLGLDQLTLYCLSVENWKRPAREVQALMKLFRRFLITEREELARQRIRLTMIGDRQGLPSAVLDELDKTLELTAANEGLTLCLAVNYGGRQEIVEAARRLARAVEQGRLAPEEIDAAQFEGQLFTRGMRDPDLLIRTAGEMRVSNFLLWQMSYAELHVTPTLWPDFRADDLDRALVDYARRQRKFGGLVDTPSPVQSAVTLSQADSNTTSGSPSSDDEQDAHGLAGLADPAAASPAPTPTTSWF
ncbi:Undecaprenyl pyrophosphate synthetase [Isosphaera pallida ATCC 43644]|uniref:Isoprenyl transferase n=1 Tax=Isosphaera pallida (strain ATCC 43644 / DSM 9630 / IS1B) TaxID=575540 RepID=E8R3J1_ISOPI|nr:isoprenyl transferase [Isosphaera pallida]ADV61558.1 Undecaprenyl pyrophosphate synthetase [Isosphaera pallida ATCC 43644]